MHNELFKIGPITIYGYGLMIAIGILSAILISEYRAKKRGLNQDVIFDLAFFSAFLGGLLGAKLLYLIVEMKSVIKNPKMIIDFRDGYVVYGGLILGVIIAILYCKIKKHNFYEYFDVVAPGIAVGQGFGRIGCFLAGCCYGKETSSVLGVVFKNSQIAPNGVKLWPTQLFSSAGDFLIALILIYFSSKDKKSGRTGALYIILYGIGRFFIEFLRNDYRGAVFGLSTSQFIAIFMVLIGIILFIKRSEEKIKA